MNNSIGFIGLGLLGTPMAEHILKNNFKLFVWGRNPDKLLPFTKQGAIIADSAQALAEQVDIIILCVTDEIAVEAVLFAEAGILAAKRTGQIIVDHSTILPAAVKPIADKVTASGRHFIDAPVTGGVRGAINSALTIFAGGEAGNLEKVRPILSLYSAKINHMGESGCGQAMKMCNQVMVLNTHILVHEALNFAKYQNLDVNKVLSAFEGSFADSKLLQFMGKAAYGSTPDNIAHIKTFMKDLQLMQATAERVHSKLYITDTTAKLINTLMEKNYGEKELAEIKRLYMDQEL